jgi:hypothetical protein
MASCGDNIIMVRAAQGSGKCHDYGKQLPFSRVDLCDAKT